MKLLYILAIFSSTIFAFSVNISNETIQNGKTVLFEFIKEDSTVYEKIVVDKKEYKIFENPINSKISYVYLPISYYEKPSKKRIEVLYREANEQKSKTIFLKVEDGRYKKEILSVDDSKIHLNKDDEKRASDEQAEAMKIYNTTTDKNFILSDFIAPMNSETTSDFGKARVYNDSLKGYHGGTDYRAKIGTPVLATNSGLVVLVKDRFYSGGSIIIDHGQGVYSCYFHMSKFSVQKGSVVSKGEVLGLSGDSGRVTGPHLHFGFRVGGEQIDPLQFIELANKNLLSKKDTGAFAAKIAQVK